MNHHLYAHAKVPDGLRHLILDIARATKYIHSAIRTTEAGLAGTINQFGEEQLQLDVLSNEMFERHLEESRLVATFVSEEQENVVELNLKAPYSVVFDPLDGSSLVDANFAIGSIVGIYSGNQVIGRKPREQVTALYVLYGPRTILVYGAGNGVHEFILNDVGEFILLRENLGVGDDAKNYSPGNLRAVTDTPFYRKAMNHWLDAKLTLRYSGCMVADIHHILSKGQGIFTNIGGSKYPEGKLRLAFECGPFAYLVTQAGGAASDGAISIMDRPIETVDQRTPLIIGSKNEVEKVAGILKNA
ncbi:fructose-1,6-bisphosphatase [Candidatus Peregrinibacteria bacterium]|nr:fructose-1,6-bisphosphatase [Candidatus Peregrinibacteria bacterium]MBI3816669.1 fructose-1,6-bisphosphatase [Candidatus Peregrinibacteria bacterium]